ncbi:MAG: hypothetical protein P4L80_00505 [Xanthobacteraceae bacterium]|nr:hypothetical protein [Xanthobacteraceae bacterium]
MLNKMPLLTRLLTKLIHDVLPAALASLIGGLLFTHFQLARMPLPAAQVAPASAEMMQLLRDEHGLIVNFLKAEMTKEKTQLAAAETAPRVVPDDAARTAPSTTAPRPAVVAAAAKPPAQRKTAIVGASLPPLVLVQEAQNESARPMSRDSDSLLAKTVGIKDHVVAVTQRVVSAIGGIPSWFGAIGDHLGGESSNPRPPADLVSAS